LIWGTGVDLIEINRVASAAAEERFNQRVFTANELRESKNISHRLAGFFAAKESLLKAMGTGLNGFSWLEMEIRHNEQGAPYFLVSGKVREFLAARGIGRIHLSISHCQHYAIAQTILEEGEFE
jgi:holo-[acyl-carrier-protein] synthase